MMLLSLHNLSKEYHLLPSETLGRATTFDFKVLDIATRWSIRQHDIANGKTPKTKEYSQDELLAILNKTKA